MWVLHLPWISSLYFLTGKEVPHPTIQCSDTLGVSSVTRIFVQRRVLSKLFRVTSYLFLLRLHNLSSGSVQIRIIGPKMCPLSNVFAPAVRPAARDTSPKSRTSVKQIIGRRDVARFRKRWGHSTTPFHISSGALPFFDASPMVPRKLVGLCYRLQWR